MGTKPLLKRITLDNTVYASFVGFSSVGTYSFAASTNTPTIALLAIANSPSLLTYMESFAQFQIKAITVSFYPTITPNQTHVVGAASYIINNLPEFGLAFVPGGVFSNNNYSMASTLRVKPLETTNKPQKKTFAFPELVGCSGEAPSTNLPSIIWGSKIWTSSNGFASLTVTPMQPELQAVQNESILMNITNQTAAVLGIPIGHVVFDYWIVFATDVAPTTV